LRAPRASQQVRVGEPSVGGCCLAPRANQAFCQGLASPCSSPFLSQAGALSGGRLLGGEGNIGRGVRCRVRQGRASRRGGKRRERERGGGGGARAPGVPRLPPSAPPATLGRLMRPAPPLHPPAMQTPPAEPRRYCIGVASARCRPQDCALHPAQKRGRRGAPPPIPGRTRTARSASCARPPAPGTCQERHWGLSGWWRACRRKSRPRPRGRPSFSCVRARRRFFLCLAIWPPPPRPALATPHHVPRSRSGDLKKLLTHPLDALSR